MIRRYFRWRAKRRLARTHYRLDRRTYHGQFQAGFLSHLRHARFWETSSDPMVRRKRRRRRFLIFLFVSLGLLLLWGIIVSIQGLSILDNG
jgi:hypothetical protein